MYQPYLTIIRHDLTGTVRQPFSWLTPLLFFVLVICFFPLALDHDAFLLHKIAPGIIWVATLLATLLSIGHLFQNEAEEGGLEGLLLSPCPLTLLVLCKVFSHWLIYCLPLISISPLLGFLLHLQPQEIGVLIITLLMGTPILSLFGALGAALMVGIRGQGLLLPILIMPLYVPILIFGTSTVMAVNHHQALNGYFAILGALMLISLACAPLLTGVALRIGANQ